MKMSNVAGVVCILSGGLMWGYRTLSDFMASSSNLAREKYAKNPHASLVDVLTPENFDWIDSIPWGFARESIDYVVQMPLFLLLLIIGIISLVIGGIFIKD